MHNIESLEKTIVINDFFKRLKFIKVLFRLF